MILSNEEVTWMSPVSSLQGGAGRGFMPLSETAMMTV
jgi:hypothetical protein